MPIFVHTIMTDLLSIEINLEHTQQVKIFFSRDINHDNDRDVFAVVESQDTIFAEVFDLLHANHSTPLKKIPLYWSTSPDRKIPDDVGVNLIDLITTKEKKELLIYTLTSAHSLAAAGSRCL